MNTGVPPGRDTLDIRQGAYLPHVTRTSGGIYAVTFRLADSLPHRVLHRLTKERDELIAAAKACAGGLSEGEERRLASLHAQRIGDFLDTGAGSCAMNEPGMAQMIADALTHFAGQRYHLHAWCVMPNHVHVLVEPLAGNRLIDVVQSWKSFTAKAANKLRGRTGPFWQPEYYDHLIRDDEDYRHAVSYIEGNPLKAGLHGWRWVSSRATQAGSPTSP